MLTREEIGGVLIAGTHGSTFGGTPFVTSVALATLTTILDGKLWERAARMGRYLTDGLRAIPTRDGAPRVIRGKGLLIGTELSGPVAPVVDACREAGLLVLSAGERVLRLAPPLIVEERDCDRALAIIATALGRA
jgi:acetylornithine/N-succinyldiaminopimelate aminotransferase